MNIKHIINVTGTMETTNILSFTKIMNDTDVKKLKSMNIMNIKDTTNIKSLRNMMNTMNIASKRMKMITAIAMKIAAKMILVTTLKTITMIE